MLVAQSMDMAPDMAYRERYRTSRMARHNGANALVRHWLRHAMQEIVKEALRRSVEFFNNELDTLPEYIYM